MRTLGVILGSVLLTFAVIGNAFYQKKQFYPSVVYITKSNPSMAVVYVQGLILVFMANSFLRKVFFGNLRAAEFEHLMEKLWYAVTETCLAFTVFRDDFSPKFIALFTLLLFLKSFHWLAEDRVDFMERSPVITWLFHVRVSSLLALLFSIDLAMLQYAFNTTATKGASVQLVFGFEYALLLTVVLNINIKYILHTIDLHRENPWDNKPVYLLYTELIIGSLKVTLYIIFVTIMVRLYTLPLFAFRPMYYTMRNFKAAFHDIIMSRRAIRNMNTLYPDATPEELAAADNVCIICREEMVTASKKLPCNHIFHTACLRSWFQRQQTCPTCRLNILRPTNNQPRTNRAENRPQPDPTPAPQPPPMQPPNPQRPPFQLPTFWPGFPPIPPNLANLGSQQQNQNPLFQSHVPNNIPFSSIVPLPPIPMPPPNLTALSEEELKTMEGNLRQAVEARIETLRRVQLLMDAAIAMMAQYQSAAATANTSPNAQCSTNLNTPNSHFKAASTNSSNSATPSNICDMETEACPEISNNSLKSNSADVRENASDTSAANNSDSIPSTSKTNLAPTSEQEVLRRRRLQKFSTESANN